MNIHFIQHETFEAPGAYLHWTEERALQVSISKVFEHQKLPESAEGIDLLIVMGGPQSPATTTAECPHFNAAEEMHLIRQCIDAGKAVVGVCLGSQLIGEALGVPFEKSPEKEIGNFPIHLTPEGLANDKINHFGKTVIVGHWHNDMPGLTPESVVLATSEGCPRQIIQYAPNVYGFQCHLELNEELVALLMESEADLETASTKHQFVQSTEQLRANSYTHMNKILYQFLDQLAGFTGEAKP